MIERLFVYAGVLLFAVVVGLLVGSEFAQLLERMPR